MEENCVYFVAKSNIHDNKAADLRRHKMFAFVIDMTHVMILKLT